MKRDDGCDDMVIEAQRLCDERAEIAREVTRDVRSWLAPLLAGGLSAARTSPIGPTAERLAQTILIGLENTIRGEADRFSEADDFPPF